jgi:starch-binding outer membrane protein, SusD/RagB family
MRKKFLYIILVGLSTSCKDIMHDEDTSLSRITSYDQLVSAAGGVYGRLTEIGIYPNEKGDDINSGNYRRYYDGVNCSYTAPDSFYFNDDWQRLYLVIASANNILDQFKISSTHDNKTRELLGEMYFIRAYCHFRLTRIYGRILIVKDADFSYSTPKATFEQVYQFIESDLNLARELLPKNNNLARLPYVTPHRGSAKAVLAEVYLAHASYPCKDNTKYSLAAKEAREVIDSANYFGLGLLPDFAYVWDSAHLYNPESVFSLYGDFYKTYASVMTDFLTAPGFTPGVQNETEINFYNNYPAGYRKEITFYTTIYLPKKQYDSVGTIIPVETGYLHIDKVDPCCRIAYRKFFYSETRIQDTHNQIFNYGIPRKYIFRFAQTVLTYAEAMARSGQLNAKAYECVNQIRRRAHHLDINTPSPFDLQAGLPADAFADSVVWERAWELCAEPEGRWFDLVRLEMVEDLPRLRHPLEGGRPMIFNKSVYFYQIPSGDKELNPNL